MNWFRIISGTVIVAVVGIIVLIQWKKIDSKTTWIYGIYILAHIILSLFVLIAFEQLLIVH